MTYSIYTIYLADTRDFRGKTYQVIEVNNQVSGKTNYYFNPTTKLLAATEMKSSADGGDGDVITWILAYTLSHPPG